MGSIPLLPYNVPVPSNEISTSLEPTPSLASTLHHLHPLKNLKIRDAVDSQLLREDPFFLLSASLATACMSWSTLLNFLEEDIKRCKEAEPGRLDLALEQLRFNSAIISRVEGFLLDNSRIISAGGCPSWPRAKESSVRERKETVQKALEEDYTFLSIRCARLAKECEIGSGILVSSVRLLESRKGIDQARQVHSLTRLAFLFIPMGFVASLFSMNVSELKTNPPIWLFFVIALPLSLLCWLLANWDEYFGENGSKIIILEFYARWRSHWPR
jgi:hypothetical protein